MVDAAPYALREQDLYLDAYSLATNRSYTFELTVNADRVGAEAKALSGSSRRRLLLAESYTLVAQLTFSIAPAPMVAVVEGVRQQSSDGPLALAGSGSYDPDLSPRETAANIPALVSPSTHKPNRNRVCTQNTLTLSLTTSLT